MSTPQETELAIQNDPKDPSGNQAEQAPNSQQNLNKEKDEKKDEFSDDVKNILESSDVPSQAQSNRAIMIKQGEKRRSSKIVAINQDYIAKNLSQSDIKSKHSKAPSIRFSVTSSIQILQNVQNPDDPDQNKEGGMAIQIVEIKFNPKNAMELVKNYFIPICTSVIIYQVTIVVMERQPLGHLLIDQTARANNVALVPQINYYIHQLWQHAHYPNIVLQFLYKFEGTDLVWRMLVGYFCKNVPAVIAFMMLPGGNFLIIPLVNLFLFITINYVTAKCKKITQEHDAKVRRLVVFCSTFFIIESMIVYFISVTLRGMMTGTVIAIFSALFQTALSTQLVDLVILLVEYDLRGKNLVLKGANLVQIVCISLQTQQFMKVEYAPNSFDFIYGLLLLLINLVYYITSFHLIYHSILLIFKAFMSLPPLAKCKKAVGGCVTKLSNSLRFDKMKSSFMKCAAKIKPTPLIEMDNEDKETLKSQFRKELAFLQLVSTSVFVVCLIMFQVTQKYYIRGLWVLYIPDVLYRKLQAQLLILTLCLIAFMIFMIILQNLLNKQFVVLSFARNGTFDDSFLFVYAFWAVNIIFFDAIYGNVLADSVWGY